MPVLALMSEPACQDDIIPAMDFAARVNCEIGLAGSELTGGVTIVMNTSFDPRKLAAARQRALPCGTESP
jgi:hypothetical protein